MLDVFIYTVKFNAQKCSLCQFFLVLGVSFEVVKLLSGDLEPVLNIELLQFNIIQLLQD